MRQQYGQGWNPYGPKRSGVKTGPKIRREPSNVTRLTREVSTKSLSFLQERREGCVVREAIRFWIAEEMDPWLRKVMVVRFLGPLHGGSIERNPNDPSSNGKRRSLGTISLEEDSVVIWGDGSSKVECHYADPDLFDVIEQSFKRLYNTAK